MGVRQAREQSSLSNSVSEELNPYAIAQQQFDTAAKYVQTTRHEEQAFWMEMILEGLHQALRLAREDLDSTITFHELMKFNVLRTVK